jgi:hypothetical protein
MVAFTRTWRISLALALALTAIISIWAMYKRQKQVEYPSVVYGREIQIADIPIDSTGGPNARQPRLAEQVRVLFRPVCITEFAEKIVVIDQGNNRLVFFDPDLKSGMPVGRKGRGPGEFDFPTWAVGKNGRLYVSDLGNRRIQILNDQGECERIVEVPLHDSRNFAVNSTGLIFLSDTDRPGSMEHLFSAYDSLGHAVRTFGSPVEYADPQAKKLMNLVMLDVDEADNIYTTFYQLPIVRKYSPEGVLLWETDLSVLGPLSKTVRNNEQQRKTQDPRSVIMSTLITSAFHNGALYVTCSVDEDDMLRFGPMVSIDARSGQIQRWVKFDEVCFAFSVHFFHDRMYVADLLRNVIIRESHNPG